MKYIIAILLLAVLIVPVLAEITEQSFVMKEDSKAEIIEIPPVTVDIQPYLSSGSLLSRNVEAKELPLKQAVTSLVKHNNRGVVTEKIVQVYPESTVELSGDASTVKQTTSGNMKLELYYGYQQSDSQPWSKYYKVEKCNMDKCRVVTADFATRSVQVHEITLAQANAIVGIPDYGVLP